MPWANFDDDFAEHPNNDRLSDAAYRLHSAGVLYANKHLTDGKIPAEKVRRLVPRFKQAALNELLTPGPNGKPHWYQNGTGYMIRDFLDWNRSRAEVMAERERKSKAGKKGAESRWQQS